MLPSDEAVIGGCVDGEMLWSMVAEVFLSLLAQPLTTLEREMQQNYHQESDCDYEGELCGGYGTPLVGWIAEIYRHEA